MLGGVLVFWERFYSLCLESGIKPNPVAKKLGFSTAVCTNWKNGTIPNGEALIKLADYFDCSVDYLLGRVGEPNWMVYDKSDTKSGKDDLTSEEIAAIRRIIKHGK